MMHTYLLYEVPFVPEIYSENDIIIIRDVTISYRLFKKEGIFKPC